MAGGTAGTPIFEREGRYLSFTVNETNGITLGNICSLDSTETQVVQGTDASTVPIGVAVAGPRTSRTATDNVIANGMKVTVCTHGVCNVIATAAAISVGGFVQCGGSGQVKALTLSTGTDVNKLIGRALEAAAGTATEAIRVLVTIL